jgi:hypothetical protein
VAVGIAVKAGDRGHEQGEHRHADEAELDEQGAPIERCVVPEGERGPEHEQDVRGDTAREGAADDVRESVPDGDQRDDELGRVAEAGIQQSADARPGVARRVFRRFPNEPRKRDEGDRGEDEEGDLARMGDDVEEEGDRREGERGPEESARHAASLTACSKRSCSTGVTR